MTPEWLSAWATVLGAVGTAGALIVAMLLLKGEQHARRADIERQSRAVPNRVWALWQGITRLEPTESDKRKGAQLAFAINARVANRSDEPVYDVVVTMPPGPESDVSAADLQVLEPGREVKVLIIHRRHPGGDSNDPFFGVPLLSFTDAAGQRWRRDGSGRLHREHPVRLEYWARMRESDRLQDAWFATWHENPIAHEDVKSMGTDKKGSSNA